MFSIDWKELLTYEIYFSIPHSDYEVFGSINLIANKKRCMFRLCLILFDSLYFFLLDAIAIKRDYNGVLIHLDG
jgi:hypothetical protein